MKTDIISDFQVVITGKIKSVEKRISQAKNTAYYIVAVERDDRYCREYEVVFVGSNAPLASTLQAGQLISVFCELRSKVWGSRVQLSLTAQAFTSAHPAAQATATATVQGNYQPAAEISDEDLPF